MRKIMLLMPIALMLAAPQSPAYNMCNKSNTPITVIVCLTQDQAIQSLNAMGWGGGQFPHPNQLLQHRGGTFSRPTIYIAQHWLIEPGACDGTNFRDLQNKFDHADKDRKTLYFMIFEAFATTGSSVIHFLTSGSYNIKNTITLTGNSETGWKATEQ